MSRSATIQARIDPKIKKQAQKILGDLQISMSEAISMYLAQVALHKGIPFSIKIPNKLTAETIVKSEQAKKIHKANSVDDLFEQLEK